MSPIKSIVPTHHIPTVKEVQECYEYLQQQGGLIPVGCLGEFELRFYFAAIMRAATEVIKENRVYWQIKEQPNFEDLTK